MAKNVVGWCVFLQTVKFMYEPTCVLDAFFECCEFANQWVAAGSKKFMGI